jgi:hypothetical protein
MTPFEVESVNLDGVSPNAMVAMPIPVRTESKPTKRLSCKYHFIKVKTRL